MRCDSLLITSSNNSKLAQYFKRCFPYLSIIILVSIAYSNTLNVPWVLDDPPNITQNTPLHINNLMPSTLWQTFFAKPFDFGELYRPIPCFTFALNWYFGQNIPFDYHVTNIIIHIITAILLYKTILLLFQTPTVSVQKHNVNIKAIALLTTLMWALHPIQIQGVTYIVQRMTSMAALFYLAAIYSYLKARLSNSLINKRKHLLLTFLFFICAILSKENAALLPLSVLLVEFILFPSSGDIFSKKIKTFIAFFSLCVLFFSIYYFFSHDFYDNFFDKHGTRPFSLYERLISQASIVVLYLSLLFYPHHNRFSISHDFEIYTSLFQSGSNAFAFLLIFFLIFIGFFCRKKIPLLSFAILFYFINHAIESTIIPLEMVFEHRNYLPSMFIFLPIAYCLLTVFGKIRIANVLIKLCLISIIISIPIIFLINTYQRNEVWISTESLWQDAYHKAPNNSRPAAQLGEMYGWDPEKSVENFDNAIMYYSKAIEARSPRASFKSSLNSNVGEVCFIYKDYPLALIYYSKALDLDPSSTYAHKGKAKTFIIMGKFQEAVEQAGLGIMASSVDSTLHTLRGLSLLWLDEPDAEKAIISFRNTIVLNKNKNPYFYNMGVALSKGGYYERAEWFFRFSSKVEEMALLFSLIENSMNYNDFEKANKYKDYLIKNYPSEEIINKLKAKREDYHNVPIDIDIIEPFIKEAIIANESKIN